MRPNAAISRTIAIIPLCILLLASTYESAASLRIPGSIASGFGRSGMQKFTVVGRDGPGHGSWLGALRGGAEAVSAGQTKVRMGKSSVYVLIHHRLM
jgi:hypothetical protein